MGPAVIGVLKPAIFLPRKFETDFTPDEQRFALAHEIAHIARGDLAASFAALLLRAIQWPNPLVHLALKAFKTDQEAACDAYVLSRFKRHGGVQKLRIRHFKIEQPQRRPRLRIIPRSPDKGEIDVD